MSAYYPPTSFHFRVEFVGVGGMVLSGEQRFQEVSGLSFEVEVDEVHEGGENRFTHKLPKRVKYPNLVLKRGLLQGSAIVNWFQEALNTWFTVLVCDFAPADLIITLMDEADQPVAVWYVVQAYPLKWSVSDFKAAENAIAVESIELAYQYFERKR